MVDPNLLIDENVAIREAMEKIDVNTKGIVFVVDSASKLIGVVVDGDIRRALLGGASLDQPVSLVMNRDFLSLSEDSSPEVIMSFFNERFRHIPLLDQEGRIKDVWGWNFFSHLPMSKPFLGGNEGRYLLDCLVTSRVSSKGQYIDQFERSFAELCGVEHAVSVMNGTAALHLALASLGVGPGDEVIVPSLTFVATANAVRYTGATPVFADCDLETWTLSPQAVEEIITPRTRGVVPVHLYGQPCQMGALNRLAEAHGLWVVEDAAEALGAYHGQRMVGSLGTIGCFSFFGNNILTTGEGGMLVTADAQLANRARMLRDQGQSRKRDYWHEMVGYNYRMTNLQAALGAAQMERWEEIWGRRQRLAEAYEQRLAGVAGLSLAPAPTHGRPVCWRYSLTLQEGPLPPGTRDALLERMGLNNIEGKPFFHPLYRLPPYRAELFHPNAEHLSRNGLCLPSYPGLKDEDIERVCEVLLNAVYEAANQG